MRVEYTQTGPHQARLVCAKHNKLVQWLSTAQAQQLESLGLAQPRGKQNG